MHSLRVGRAVVTALVFCGFARAEPLSPAAARAAVREAQPRLEPGSYRLQTVRKTRHGTATTTTFLSRPLAGPTLSRTETVNVDDRHPEQKRTTVSITNREGRWQLYGNKALLMPSPFDRAKVLQALNDAALRPDPAASTPAPAGATEPWMRQAAALATHIRIEGETFSENGRTLIRVTRTFDPEVTDFIERVVQEQLDALKKQLSFGKRMLLGTVLAMKGGVGNLLPAREVLIIDAATHRLESTESYNAAGKLLRQQAAPASPERIADLPPETFVLGASVELIRPKNLGEALELAEKLGREQRDERAVAVE